MWHEEAELPVARRSRAPRRLLLRRLSALRRDRTLLARDAAVCASRRAAGSCSASATASRCCARRGCPGRAPAERVASLRLPRRGAARRAHRHAVHRALLRRPDARHPGEARRRALRPAAGSRSGADRLPLPRQPERLRRRHRGRSATRPATSWGSCRTPNTPSTLSSGRPTARSSSRRSSTPRVSARSRASSPASRTGRRRRRRPARCRSWRSRSARSCADTVARGSERSEGTCADGSQLA